MKLFNLFGGNNTTTVQTVETSTKSNYPKEVLEIHHEFEIASDKLLKEATDIINAQPKVNESKINRLSALGFKQVAEVKTAKTILETTQLSKETIDLIQYYKQNYPYQKFITEEQVKYICHKYNLVCGDVNRFRGFVPDKNLKEIENFKLKDKDIIVSGVCWGSDIFSKDKIKHSITLDLYNELLSKKLIKGDGKGNLSLDDNWCNGLDIGINYTYFDRITKEKLQICAPVKDMDISGLELKKGYKLEKKFIPDPIVLQPVKGGYLILTMWADETFDPFIEPMLRNDELLN